MQSLFSRQTLVLNHSENGKHWFLEPRRFAELHADQRQSYGLSQRFLRPEFLNHLDEIIVFDILPAEKIKEIVTLRINALKTRMMEKGITLQVSDAALEYLAKEGYNPHYGARPLNRLIQTKILNQIASFIIAGTEAETAT